ncbi:hypothetical protein EV138_7246 [Kribbella voronezhensis]|uniref:Uncharacterized protein n=1 Tax=Kribbella voronezhensis TaxID=2512212 RepID=A0A4R7SUW3_9ACTN|nr:hypothetical protein [Kribbella voronezhensis]TDU82356.1 hypothetical protein EV138_7246 [Kribbella voronezhensis]
MADVNRQPSLDQAAADGSITGARHRAVEPVPIVADSVDVATLDGVDDVLPVPVPGVRRRLTPRPVPGNKRKKPPVLGPAADEEPTPAEEMDDVGTHDDKAAPAADAEKAVTPPGVEAEETPAGATVRGSTATATKAAKPKTAAEIVAAQREREKAAAAAKTDDTSVTTPLTRQPAAASTPSVGKPATGTAATGAVGNKTAVKKTVTAKVAPTAKGKAAMSTVGTGVKQVRNLIASVIWLIAVLAAAVLALGALFTALDQANQSNEIVRFVLDRGHDIVGPFKDLFRLETAKNTLLVNWGIAALVYLIAGKILERFIRP